MATQGPRGDAGSDGTPVGGTPPTRTVRTLTPPAAGMPYRAGGATEHDAAVTAGRADPRVAEAFALAVLLTSALQPARTVARTLAA